MKKDYTVKNPYYIDQQTGFITPGTQVIETDDRYKNRYLTWKGPIPKNGRVDLAAYQQQLSQGDVKTADEIADYEAFKKWQAEQKGAPATETPTATATVSVPGPVTVSKSPSVQEAKAPEESAPVLTVEQRHAKIMEVMPNLTVNDMTKSPTNPMPAVSALSRLTGLADIQGSEREAAWEEFKKANPDWKPKAAE